MIVDDQAPFRLAAKAVLRRMEGFELVGEAKDGVEAISLAHELRPDLVLMDIHMSNMDGLAATRQIREFHPQARVVVVTDYDDDDLRKAASEAGACGYALKQNLTELPGLIRSIVEKN